LPLTRRTSYCLLFKVYECLIYTKVVHIVDGHLGATLPKRPRVGRRSDRCIVLVLLRLFGVFLNVHYGFLRIDIVITLVFVIQSEHFVGVELGLMVSNEGVDVVVGKLYIRVQLEIFHVYITIPRLNVHKLIGSCHLVNSL
jgi:hypothetical protein